MSFTSDATAKSSDVLDFSIDENTGEIRTARPLLNLARAAPYVLRVMATDNGEPQSTTGVDLRVFVLESTAVQAREESHLQLISPPVDFVLRIEEVREDVAE